MPEESRYEAFLKDLLALAWHGTVLEDEEDQNYFAYSRIHLNFLPALSLLGFY
jgi:hypothetical protein